MTSPIGAVIAGLLLITVAYVSSVFRDVITFGLLFAVLICRAARPVHRHFERGTPVMDLLSSILVPILIDVIAVLGLYVITATGRLSAGHAAFFASAVTRAA